MPHSEMKIFVPDEIAEYEPDLRLFFDLMVQKLYHNRHKGWGGVPHVNVLLTGLHGEINELRQAMADGSQTDVQLEAVDVANFGLLLALWAVRQDKASFKRAQASLRTQGMAKDTSK